MQYQNTIDPLVLDRARQWTQEPFDAETRYQVNRMLENDPIALTDSFYKDLEFGTGGLRGIMGAGTNKMNRYTVGMATQGLANYLKACYPDETPKVAIAHDSRNNSRFFAQTAADVLTANGLEVYLFDALRPTPELSFSVRELGAHAGIVVTASHNPKEYNGYKVYWSDGGQLVPPHDENIIAEVRKIGGPAQVNFQARPELLHTLGAEMDERYWQRICQLSLGDAGKKDLKIIYTPIHGTGIMGVPQVLQKMGFTQVEVLEAQKTPDGNFPTVHSPNPEEAAALDLAIRRGRETGADLVLGTDPDSDRVGIATVNEAGELVLLNGNETAAILVHYILSHKAEQGLHGNEFIAKTIVTTDLLSDIARQFGVECYECLTGFKYIAEIIREQEGKKHYLVGGEESYGYLVGDFVRDKDAVSSAALIAEAAAWAKSQGMTLTGYLEKIHRENAVYLEDLISITKQGKAGAEEIRQMMDGFRNKPMSAINGQKVIITRDYRNRIERNLVDGTTENLSLPASNVFQFVLEDRSIITARPSGTEPKIKFYISVRQVMLPTDDYRKVQEFLQERIKRIKADLGF